MNCTIRRQSVSPSGRSGLLLAAAGLIVYECITKIIHSEEVGGWAVIITAGLGVFIKGLTALFLVKEQAHDLNIKGAYLHILADTLVSTGVVVSGLLILLTGWNILDPVIGIVIALAILVPSWGVFKESLRMTMDGVPPGICAEGICKYMLDSSGVRSVHHLHVWAVSTTENALTAHVVVDNVRKIDKIRELLHRELAGHGITHATLEFETAGAVCGSMAHGGEVCSGRV